MTEGSAHPLTRLGSVALLRGALLGGALVFATGAPTWAPMGAVAAVVAFVELRGNRPGRRALTAVMILALALLGAIPAVAHGIYLEGVIDERSIVGGITNLEAAWAGWSAVPMKDPALERTFPWQFPWYMNESGQCPTDSCLLVGTLLALAETGRLVVGRVLDLSRASTGKVPGASERGVMAFVAGVVATFLGLLIANVVVPGEPSPIRAWGTSLPGFTERLAVTWVAFVVTTTHTLFGALGDALLASRAPAGRLLRPEPEPEAPEDRGSPVAG